MRRMIAYISVRLLLGPELQIQTLGGIDDDNPGYGVKTLSGRPQQDGRLGEDRYRLHSVGGALVSRRICFVAIAVWWSRLRHSSTGASAVAVSGGLRERLLELNSRSPCRWPSWP